MKRILFITLTFAFSLSLIGFGSVIAEDDVDVNKDVQLTDGQKQEMEELHTKLFDVHKQILEKYAEYGVLPKEKAAEKIAHMEEYHQKLKEDGYIPDWHMKKDKMKRKD